MDDRLIKIEEKVDETLEKISEINITLTKQHFSLEEHIKRTRLAEENIEILRSELKPVEKHVSNMQFLAKTILFIGSAAALVASILAIVKNI
jgi:chromosome segregation ATPase